jgi:hypothetical protein
MKKGKLFFTIGLPRSGKTDYCNRWVEEGHWTWHAKQGKGSTEFTIQIINARVVVGGDDFRTAIYGREFQAEAEGLTFATMDVAIRALLSRGHDVIIDETSTTKETIKRWLRIDIEAKPVYIPCSVEECKKRALTTGKPYLIPAIERMSKQLEEILLFGIENTINELKGEVLSRREQDVSV